LNAEKSVGGHVKKSITSSFFNRNKFYLAVKCNGFQQINVYNSKLKFQAVIEKTAKNFRGLLFLATPCSISTVCVPMQYYRSLCVTLTNLCVIAQVSACIKLF